MHANTTLLDRIIFHPTLCDRWKFFFEGAVYHLAACVLFLGFMGGSGPFGAIYIFGFLAAGFFCLALWGWLDACGIDVFTWNVLLVLICGLQLAHLLFQLWKDTVSKDFEQIYKQVCQPLRVPLRVYKEIVKCCEERVLPLARDQTYAVEGKTAIDRLSLLLSGRIRVSQDGQFLHYIFPYQFLDSPEWESLRPSEEGTFQVTLTAETDCSFVSWPRRPLYSLLAKERYIARLFSVLLGYDISEKLYALNEKLFAKFGLRFDIRLPSLYHVLGPASSDAEVEQQPAEPEEPPVPLRPPLSTFVQASPSTSCVPPPTEPRVPVGKPRPDSDLSASGNLLRNNRQALAKGRAPLAPTQTPEL
ncbi:popeye domain-containing protein 2 isoform X2 [Sphaerodactylus townsendi]|uniref:popeye domain-containing protein 2 isoform X2 n=1 Tax=Sphaerodactylus townsendi TaxID=933632 RepID=UPI0020260586|nr:popeye domain-containing protein 2 isoform X2 [Sphaerodactylus townsendi]